MLTAALCLQVVRLACGRRQILTPWTGGVSTFKKSLAAVGNVSQLIPYCCEEKRTSDCDAAVFHQAVALWSYDYSIKSSSLCVSVCFYYAVSNMLHSIAITELFSLLTNLFFWKEEKPKLFFWQLFFLQTEASHTQTVSLERESVCWGGGWRGGRNNILYLSDRKQSRSGALSCDTIKTVRSQSGKIKRCSTDTKQQTQHSQQTGVLLIVSLDPSTKLKFLQLL